jgi:DNA-directed RNA polymerase I, II, and III subunit RPABC2
MHQEFHATFIENERRYAEDKRGMDHPEVKPVFRPEVVEALKTPRTTKPFFTKYEYVDMLAARAQQIADGAKPLVGLEGLKTSDPMFLWNVAKREIEQRKLPFMVRRQLPNGTSEYWSAQELEMSW